MTNLKILETPASKVNICCHSHITGIIPYTSKANYHLEGEGGMSWKISELDVKNYISAHISASDCRPQLSQELSKFH